MFKRLTNYFDGRHTLFICFFSVTALILAWFGKLNSQYVAMVTALQAFVLVHSAKEDIVELKKNGNGAVE